MLTDTMTKFFNPYLVPNTYLLDVNTSGWTRILSFFIASLLVAACNSMGVISGQEMFVLGGTSSEGFS